MSDSTELYNVRILFDPSRQPNLKPTLSEFDAFLRSIQVTQPYSLSRAQRRALANQCPDFACGCQGPMADKVVDPYVYRLSSIPSILRLNGSNSDLRADQLHDFFLSDFNANGRWISLARLLDGTLRGWRGFTFWTDLEFAADAPLRTAYQAGLPRDQISSRSIILRCATSPLRMRIPTILDGYEFPPFCAVKSHDHNGHGEAVDLTQPETLQLGSAEFVVGDIPVDWIEFKPVICLLPIDLTHRLDDGSLLWVQLRDFFAKLMEAKPSDGFFS